jgi:hypothetical protein
MKKEVAKHIAASAMRCFTRLSGILPFAKAHCSDTEYRRLALFGVIIEFDDDGRDEGMREPATR